MKKLIIISIIFFTSLSFKINAQDNHEREQYGKTLNLGLGIGYYGYIGHSLPVFNLNYEFDVARNFTLAPFISYYSYRSNYYWGNKNYPYKNYSYRETSVPVGIKGTYYFDGLFHASPKWDFYGAASLGFVFRSVTWEGDYYGDKYGYRDGSSLYLDVHIGAEYKFNSKLGLFLDLSTGVSTVGLGFHF